MQILESLEAQVPETDTLQRTVIVGPDTGASHLSAVLVRVPPYHEFPLHTHPRSEDCFFVLSGDGEAFGPEKRFAISESSGVWIPAGVPHGLAAGASGMLEIGFQSPGDPTAVPFETTPDASWPNGMLVESMADDAAQTVGSGRWSSSFGRRAAWRCLDPYYAVLRVSQQIRAAAEGYEVVLVLARGAIELSESGRTIRGMATLHLRLGETATLRALESPTRLLAVRAFVAA